jgi:alanine racemase
MVNFSNENALITLDVKALAHNFNVVKRRVKDAFIFAVVKANAYGHGLATVTQALKHADGFAVSSLSEAATIRQWFPEKPVLWLSGFSTPRELAYVADLKVKPLIHHVEQIKMLEAQKSSVDIFLKINTGMNRIGFLPEDFPNIYQRLIDCSSVNNTFTLMTHFAEAEAIHLDFTHQQMHLFNQLTHNLPHARSLANSAAIWAWPESIQDCVRPGISLYGISPFKGQIGEDLGLKPVMTFQSRLIAINHCRQGDRVGYGGTWIAPKDTYIGVVDVGYADGYTRHVRNGTPILIDGRFYSLVGRVSMNMITVNLEKNIHKVQVNDKVTLWGNELPIERIAAYSDTIPYTLLTGISSNINKTICHSRGDGNL